MSRWFDEFRSHPFQTSWTALKEELSTIEVDDQTIITNVQELARLKKIIRFIDEIQSSLDPELVPRSTWTSFHQQLGPCFQQIQSYKSSKNITNLNQANEHADNLLSYVKPYFVVPADLLEALKLSASSYESQFSGYAETFRDKSRSLLDEIKKSKDQVDQSLKDISSASKKSEIFYEKLFVKKDEVDSIEGSVNSFVVKIQAESEEINQLHAELLIGDKSKKSIIDATKQAILEDKEEIKEQLAAVKIEVDEFEKYHKQIFGDKTSIGESGLKFEISTRMKDLSKFEIDSKEKTQALFKQIEDLLPGATSAGLASAYRELKEGFNDPIKNYTKAFYGSLGLLILASVVMSVSHISLFPALELKFVEIPQWDSILRALIYKTPFVVPIVWLAIFSAKRRSQYERLQQEYAHKESLAKSYESYKLQLKELKVGSEDLQKALIETAVKAIAFNASGTLDGNHEESTPIAQLLSKCKPEEWKTLLDFLKKDGK